MSFQLPAPTTTNASTGFSFGLTSTPATGAAAAAKPSSFTFGSTGGGDAGTTKPLSMGLGTTAAAAPATVGVGGGLAGGFFSQQTATSTAPTLGGLGGTTATAPAATSTAAAPTLNFSAPVASTAATAASNTAAASTFPMPKQAAGVALGQPATAPAAATQAQAAPTQASTGFASLTSATKTTNSAAVATATQVSYNQLEEHINKWTLELEEQEKIFTDQATQINAWDKILISNNQKILELNDAVQKVKSDQQTLEQELEFIATQHHELEESIVPLQKEFMKIPQVDMERSQTYLMVENLDTQLKQMSEDLKEIIENLNEANKGQDNTDPIIQIGKILNAHMSSLQWIEASSANIGNKLEDITKMHESFKRDSERSFRSAYYN